MGLLEKRAERKGLLDSCINTGKIFSVTWRKKSGEETCRTFTKKAYIAKQKATTAHIPEYVRMTESVNKDQKMKWSTVNLDTLISVKSQGKVYNF